MNNAWIVITNASEASIYHLNPQALKKKKIALDLMLSFNHPNSRKKDGELISDRSGHFYNSHLGHGSYNAATEPKMHEAEVFAKEIVDRLESARTQKQFDQLILFAPAHFQGLINKHINKNLEHMIHSKFDKDYTKLPVKTLLEYVSSHLLPPEAADSNNET